MNVYCTIRRATLLDEAGRPVDGVIANCDDCGAETQSFGDGERSVARCLALMRDVCPYGGRGFYMAGNELPEDDSWEVTE